MTRITAALIIIITLSVSIPTQAAIIFEDNFDAVGTVTLGVDTPTLWTEWLAQGVAASATRDAVTHYGGEITYPGWGGAGKSLKQWRNSQMEVQSWNI